MFRSLVAVAVGLLLVTQLNAEDKPKESAADKKPEAKAEAGVKAAAEPTKANAETKTEPAARGRAGGRGQRGGEGHRGRVTKATLENGVLKLSVDGKEYELAIGEKTHAMIRTADKDGKEEVVGVMLMNGERGQRPRGTGGKPRTRPTTKP